MDIVRRKICQYKFILSSANLKKAEQATKNLQHKSNQWNSGSSMNVRIAWVPG